MASRLTNPNDIPIEFIMGRYGNNVRAVFRFMNDVERVLENEDIRFLGELPRRGGMIEFWCDGGEVEAQPHRHHWSKVKVGPVGMAIAMRCIDYCKGPGEFPEVDRWVRVKQ